LLSFFTRPFTRVDHPNIETSLIGQFLYPSLGPGQYWEFVARRIIAQGGKLRTGHKVVRFETVKKDECLSVVGAIVREQATGREYRIKPDAVVSSMPIKDLISALGSVVPERVRSLAAGLPYRDFMTVGLLVHRLLVKSSNGGLIPDCWIYVQEPDVFLGRIQVFNNWSPNMVASPEDTVWLGLEYFCAEGDELWERSNEDFIALATEELVQLGIIESSDVLDATVQRVKKAYPAYFGSYEHFDEIRFFLNGFDNLFCVGRNGQHRYNNMDHSMLTSYEAIRVLLDDSSDKNSIWEINSEQAYNEERESSERSVHAGES
jgi:protoporphyrinogen oxidase